MPPPIPRLPMPGQPIPGTEPTPRALFVDRWGTLLEPPLQDGSLGDARFFPEAVDALFRAAHDGWNIYLIGNEDAVARGRVSDQDWRRFEQQVVDHLASLGVRVRRCYACLDDPQNGCGKHRRDSVYLLPNTGPMYHAMQHDGVDLSESWVIGDGVLELVAGWRAGCRLAAVGATPPTPEGELQVEPELVADDLASVIRALLRATS